MMLAKYEKLEDLEHQKSTLEGRIRAIKNDLKSGLDPDSEEQAVQLENYEVLMELLRTAEEELVTVNQKINNMEKGLHK